MVGCGRKLFVGTWYVRMPEAAVGRNITLGSTMPGLKLPDANQKPWNQKCDKDEARQGASNNAWRAKCFFQNRPEAFSFALRLTLTKSPPALF